MKSIICVYKFLNNKDTFHTIYIHGKFKKKNRTSTSQQCLSITPLREAALVKADRVGVRIGVVHGVVGQL